MTVPNPIHQRLHAFQQLPRMRAGSLIISAFGDAIYPRGGVVWLGCLIRLLEPLALNERLVRTAIFRLVKEDWLQAQTMGRRTDYGLSATGRSRIEEASKLIYGNPTSQWDEHWRIIFTSAEQSPQSRAALRKALYWQGFGEWNANTFLHPSADLNQVTASLSADGLQQELLDSWTLISKIVPTPFTISDKQVVAQAWDLKQLGQSYANFIAQYQTIDSRFDKLKASDEEAFLTRLLLVHDFRRLLLRDPMLPNTLLPGHWPGLKARQLFNRLYSKLHEASENHLDMHLQKADESVPRRGSLLSKRIAAMHVDMKMV